MKLVKQGTIPASLADTSVQLSVVGSFQLVEDLVTEMMGLLHIDGVTCMREYGAMWVFVRNRVELRQALHWMDAYIAECYISAFTGVKLVIDTVLKRDSEIALASRLELCAVDLTTGKIRRSNTVGLGENTPPEETEIDLTFSRERFEPEIPTEEITIRSAEIDFCHHTNNISYIRYLVNRYSVAQMERAPIKAVEVQYRGYFDRQRFPAGEGAANRPPAVRRPLPPGFCGKPGQDLSRRNPVQNSGVYAKERIILMWCAKT